MNVPIENLLVNRSSLTRGLKIAGIPVYQMPTHTPAYVDYIKCPSEFRGRFGKLAYNYIQEISLSAKYGGQRGGYDKLEPFENLIKDITTNGIKEPLPGWDLRTHRTIELSSGHHRAAIAYAAGFKEVPVKLKSLDPLLYIPKTKLSQIRDVYNKVPETQALKKGYSYNSFPGLLSIRKSLYRLGLIYADIITCNGNSLIDLGCNDGFFGISLSKHDFDVTFVDRCKVYLDVVKEKLCALGRNIRIFQGTIGHNILRKDFNPDVVIYMDVYYHTVLENGLNEANKQLQRILDCTNERLIFAPGRWDKLEKLGCTQKDLFEMLVKNSRQIKYLGHDLDRGYHREIYSIYK